MKNIFFSLFLVFSVSANAALTFSFSTTTATVNVGDSLDLILSVELEAGDSLIGFDFLSTLESAAFAPNSFTVTLANWSDGSVGNNVSALADFLPPGDLTMAGTYTLGTINYTFNNYGLNQNLVLAFDDDTYGTDSGATDSSVNDIPRNNITLASAEIDVIPEPGLLLASAGALGFLAARRRRQLPAA